MQYLFVYGTLMRRFNNPYARLLRQYARFLEEGSFVGRLYKLDGYPGAVAETDPSTRVYGEIFEVHRPDELFPELDAYEDISDDPDTSLYIRRQIEVQAASGQPIHCWVYLYNQSVEGYKSYPSGYFEA
jgi:gamma-glutamylcyclotransferase (GGCT)/AIG2-like uncharacterized protein YtfP